MSSWVRVFLASLKKGYIIDLKSLEWPSPRECPSSCINTDTSNDSVKHYKFGYLLPHKEVGAVMEKLRKACVLD